MTRLPIVWTEPCGSRQHYAYWKNFCDNNATLTSLEREWKGKLYDYIMQDAPPYIEFETSEHLTAFLLRWS